MAGSAGNDLRRWSALQRVVDAHDSLEKMPEAIETARNEVIRTLKGR